MPDFRLALVRHQIWVPDASLGIVIHHEIPGLPRLGVYKVDPVSALALTAEVEHLVVRDRPVGLCVFTLDLFSLVFNCFERAELDLGDEPDVVFSVADE